MEWNESKAKPRGRAQICGLVTICLLSAMGFAYLVRASFHEGAVQSPAAGPALVSAPDVKSGLAIKQLQAERQAKTLVAQLRDSPDDPYLLAEIGKIHYQMRRFAVAANYYEASFNLKPDAMVLVKLGGAYHYDGNNEKAIGAWNHALRLDPDNPDALFNIGYVKWHDQRDPKAAMAAWQKLLKLNPNHPKRAQVERLLAQAKQYLENQMARND